MPIDSHNSGLADMSRTMPRNTAIRMPSEILKNGSCSRLSNSELIAFASPQARRIARMHLPVSAPSGAISRRAQPSPLATPRRRLTFARPGRLQKTKR
jgi:hypothetical protein